MGHRVILLLAAAVLAAGPVPSSPVVRPGHVPTGQTLLDPAFARVPAGEATLVFHTLATGGPGRVAFRLEAREVVADGLGAPTLGPVTDSVDLPTDRVVLDAGEQARFGSVVRPAAAAGVVAIEAVPLGHDGRPTGADGPVAYLAASPAAALSLTVEPRLDAGVVEVLVAVAPGAGAASADIAVRLRSPTGGTIFRDDLDGVLVLPGTPRRLRWELELPAWPGPYELAAAAKPAGTESGETTRATATVWGEARAWVSWVAAALVLVTAAAWLWARRRLRRRAA